MFEARMAQATVLKRVLEAVKDMVNEGNFDCSEEGICLQAMDVAHVSLVNVLLRGQGFEMFRCDRNLALGIQLANLSKVLNCAGKDDAVTIKAEDEGADTAEFMFESAKGDRITTFELTLMDIDSEHLGVPEDTTYTAVIKMPSNEFRRIISDLSTIGDTVTIGTLGGEAEGGERAPACDRWGGIGSLCLGGCRLSSGWLRCICGRARCTLGWVSWPRWEVRACVERPVTDASFSLLS